MAVWSKALPLIAFTTANGWESEVSLYICTCCRIYIPRN